LCYKLYEWPCSKSNHPEDYKGPRTSIRLTSSQSSFQFNLHDGTQHKHPIFIVPILNQPNPITLGVLHNDFGILQFPKPLIGPEQRKHGGIIVHIIVAVYTFLGLAIVCDEYFVASLDRICEELKMSPDVAGATFMAAGSSAPELATVIIGVFFAKDDIGG
jgi:hypothetical protein